MALGGHYCRVVISLSQKCLITISQGSPEDKQEAYSEPLLFSMPCFSVYSFRELLFLFFEALSCLVFLKHYWRSGIAWYSIHTQLDPTASDSNPSSSLLNLWDLGQVIYCLGLSYSGVWVNWLFKKKFKNRKKTLWCVVVAKFYCISDSLTLPVGPHTLLCHSYHIDNMKIVKQYFPQSYYEDCQ